MFININIFAELLEDLAGERMPLAKMGFQHINQFLYQMENYIELRKVDDRIYIFVRINTKFLWTLSSY